MLYLKKPNITEIMSNLPTNSAKTGDLCNCSSGGGCCGGGGKGGGAAAGQQRGGFVCKCSANCKCGCKQGNPCTCNASYANAAYSQATAQSLLSAQQRWQDNELGGCSSCKKSR